VEACVFSRMAEQAESRFAGANARWLRSRQRKKRVRVECPEGLSSFSERA
jgi:hypothetical protein